MSDDTPTQRFPSADSGDTPTPQLLTAEIVDDLPEEKKSRGLMTGLVITGALLLIALIVLLVIFLGRGAGAPQAVDTASPAPTDSATPTPTPEPTETEAPPPPPAGPAISSFTVSNESVFCNTQSPTPSHQYIGFEWATSGSTRVYFGIDTDDASTNAFFDNLPQTGNSQSDFPAGYNDYEYACPAASHTYTLTVVDGDGNKQSKSVTVVNDGDTQ
jgi:hypothetical protein